MKRSDKIRDEFVRQWSLKAEEDFNAAKSLITYGHAFLSTVCFHSQQAAEKYLKAFLTYHQIEFPKTHDIGELLDLAARVDNEISESEFEGNFCRYARFDNETGKFSIGSRFLKKQNR